MNKNFIIHNGVQMVEEWPARIAEAQEMTMYLIGDREYPRVRFGDEATTGVPAEIPVMIAVC